MSKFYKSIVITVLIVMASTSAFASTSLFGSDTSSMRSIAALGMGNAYYGLSNSKYAPFYNPAGLADVPRWSVDLIPVTVGVNSNIISLGSSITEDFSSLMNDLSDLDTLKDVLTRLSGDYLSVTPVTFFPAFTKKNLTVGVYATADIDLLASNINVMPELSARITADVGVSAGYAMQFLDDSLSVGIGLRGFYRASATKSYTAIDLATLIADESAMDSLLDDINSNGTGFAVLGTLGAMYTLPVVDWLAPKVSLSLNDVGYKNFGSEVEDVPWTVNGGISVSPSFSFISSYVALEMTDILFNDDSDSSVTKRINMGAEVGFWDRIYLRGGLHKGYLTGGFGLDFGTVFKLNYAYYVEELGAYAGQYPDKRHVVEIVFGI